MYKTALRSILIFLSILSNPAQSQEVVLEFDTEYDAGPALINNSFSLVDENTNDFTVFLTNNSNLSAFNFNNSFGFEGWLASRELPNKYKIPLGGTINERVYSLFYSNDNKSKFAVITFDFTKNWSFTSEIDLKLKKESYLTQFVYKNKFHILTTAYKDNLLFLYSFENSGEYTKETIDLSTYEFYGPASYPTKLMTALGQDLHHREITKTVTVKEGVPYSLDSMVSLIKLYLFEDSFYLSTDINSAFTQIIIYNLETSETNFKNIKQGEVEFSRTNSFLNKNHLYQMAVNTKQMIFNITDLNSEKILKNHEISKKDSLYLANGPIRQRGGRYKNYRELEKTAQFLRKLGNGNPALFVKENNDNYEITIGSVDEIDDGLIAAIAYMNPFTAVATFGALTLYANPVALAMLKASNSRAVYINNILDKNFEPTFQKERDNIFYKISDYIEKEDIKRFTASDVFIYNDYYLFGMLDKKSKKYVFRKFIP